MTPEDPWIAYARTIVEVAPPARATFRILPAPKGEVGTWPSGFRAEIFVITAWNPHSQLLDDNENRVRQESLDSEYREEGVAISGLSEVEAISLGARYEQNAIFTWTPVAWSILSCIDKRREDSGWRLDEPRKTS
jgi:hypothetical protein